MVYINLLPVREIKRRARAKSQVSGFFVVLFFLLAALAVAAFLQSSQAKQLESDIAALKQEEQKYAGVLAEIKKLDADKALLEKRTGIIEQLREESSLTVHVMDEIANIIPTERMWLESVSQSGSSLQLTGMALDNRTVASFMEELRKSSYIQNVELNTTSLKEFAGRDLKSFSLNCAVATPAEEKDTEAIKKK